MYCIDKLGFWSSFFQYNTKESALKPLFFNIIDYSAKLFGKEFSEILTFQYKTKELTSKT